MKVLPIFSSSARVKRLKLTLNIISQVPITVIKYKCKKVFNSDTAFVTPLKSKKNEKLLLLRARRHYGDVLPKVIAPF